MSDSEFEARVTNAEDGVTIELVGTVNRSAKEGMEAAYAGATEFSGEITLDFNRVDYINSTGIAVIVGILAMAKAEGRGVSAFGLTDHYREVFRITRLSDFMTIHEDAHA